MLSFSNLRSIALPDFGPLHFESAAGGSGCVGTTLAFSASCAVQCMSGYVSNGGDVSFGCFQTLSYPQLECSLPAPIDAKIASAATKIVWCKAGGVPLPFCAFPVSSVCLRSVVQRKFTSAELDSAASGPQLAVGIRLGGIARVALSFRSRSCRGNFQACAVCAAFDFHYSQVQRSHLVCNEAVAMNWHCSATR